MIEVWSRGSQVLVSPRVRCEAATLRWSKLFAHLLANFFWSKAGVSSLIPVRLLEIPK